MEVYRTEDGLVSKYVHDDGSETTIKSVNSCGNMFNKVTGKLETIEVDKNKFSVFISSSVGCPLGCKFCYLTIKKCPYKQLAPIQIFNNVKEALSAETLFKPELRKKYMKLSWMGMGDAFLLDPKDIRTISNNIIRWAVRDAGRAWGIDGIDIATILPKSKPGWPHQLAMLNDDCDDYRINPINKGRSNLRLFYSLHKFEDRKTLIPGSRFDDSANDLQLLNQFKQWYGIDVILHHLFLEGINDTEYDLSNIKAVINCLIDDAEFRILRFNACENSPYRESNRFEELVKLYAMALPKVKYQTSAGVEINAACGMFLKPNYEFKEF